MYCLLNTPVVYFYTVVFVFYEKLLHASSCEVLLGKWITELQAYKHSHAVLVSLLAYARSSVKPPMAHFHEPVCAEDPRLCSCMRGPAQLMPDVLFLFPTKIFYFG